MTKKQTRRPEKFSLAVVLMLAAVANENDEGDLFIDIDRVGHDNYMMARFASKIMHGKPYSITDNPKLIRMQKAIVKRLGA